MVQYLGVTLDVKCKDRETLQSDDAVYLTGYNKSEMLYDPEKINYFAETDARNKRVKFGIKAKDRTRHVYVIGKTGMGKSTMLENMAIQDIQNGEGLAFLDPHGKTADLLLDYVPEERIKDVIYFAPFDTDYPISFNVMEDVGQARRHLVVSGLMSAFEKIWVDAWSARMAYILQNTLSALLEFPDATMLGINRMLSDKVYRNKVVSNISDPSVKSFWTDEFAKYTERFAAEATPAIQNKVGQFVNNSLIRNILGQSRSSFDMRKIMDEKKILIINLSKGQVGESNAKLLGGMLITKIYLAAMSRADSNEETLNKLPNFYLYVDEFQSFANKSFADILSEARKYKLNLTIAHQYVEQMEEEVRDAVFGNVGTMVAFRVGALDAELLEKEFAPTFTAEDMVNLGFVQIYLKLMIDGISSQPFSATTLPPIPKPARTYRSEIVDASRMQFAHPRAAVEEAIKKWHEEGSARSEKADVGKFGPKVEEHHARKDTEREKKEVFETIVQKEKQKDHIHAVSTPVVEEKKVSLHELERNNPKKDKGPSSNHVSQLRQALEELNKRGGAERAVPKKEEPKPEIKQESKTPEPEAKREPVQNHEKKTKNEIPHDELLSLLKVDGE